MTEHLNNAVRWAKCPYSYAYSYGQTGLIRHNYNYLPEKNW